MPLIKTVEVIHNSNNLPIDGLEARENDFEWVMLEISNFKNQRCHTPCGI